eukprot:1150859-Pelagomonas_calceolata.AAC.2
MARSDLKKKHQKEHVWQIGQLTPSGRSKFNKSIMIQSLMHFTKYVSPPKWMLMTGSWGVSPSGVRCGRQSGSVLGEQSNLEG